MKKNVVLNALLIFFSSFLLASCVKTELYDDLSLSEKTISLRMGEESTVLITGGSGSYKVQSDDSNIASAVLEKDKILITGKTLGITLIKVSDTLSGQSDNIKVSVEVPHLELSVNSLAIEGKGSKEILITKGSGSYQVKSEDPAIVSASINESTIVVTSEALGSTLIIIEDVLSKENVKVPVTVEAGRYELSLNQIIDMLNIPNSELFNTLALSFMEEVNTNQLYQYLYITNTEGVNTKMKVELVPSNEKWAIAVQPEEGEDNLDFFNKILNLLWTNKKAGFRSAQLLAYDDNGAPVEDHPTIFDDANKFKNELSNVDLKKVLARVGFRTTNGSVEIQNNKGVGTLYIRPLLNHDNFKWYQKMYFGANFDKTLSELFYIVESSGFIPAPPFLQLFIIEGKDQREELFNLVFFAVSGQPISRIEASYFALNENVESAKKYWIELMKSDNVSERFGIFENTMILPLSSDAQPIELKSIQETIEWVQNNDLTNETAVLPIFRVEGERVIIPQLTSSGLVVIMDSLSKSTSARKNYSRLYRAE